MVSDLAFDADPDLNPTPSSNMLENQILWFFLEKYSLAGFCPTKLVGLIPVLILIVCPTLVV
jgi:hypothetical protein